MKKIAALLLACAMVFAFVAGCSGDSKTPNGGDSAKTEDLSKVKTPATELLGFTLAEKQEITSVYSGEVTTLNYLITTSQDEFGLCANFVDSLVDYNQFGAMVPSLAESWKISDDGLTYTFTLRNTAKWFNYDGTYYADVVAQDFVDGLKYVFTKENASTSASFAYDIIKNGHKYYSGDITDFAEVGVKALDERTVEYTLEAPCPYFLSLTTYMCFWPANGTFLAETGEDFGTDNNMILYCGAYLFPEFEPQVSKVRVKNPDYWDADNIHVTKMTSTYNKEAASVAAELYLRGETTSLGIPSALLQDWMNDPTKEAIIRPSTLSFYTYFMSLNFDPQFDEAFEPENWKKAVNTTSFRKSLFYALDKKAAMMTVDPYDPDHIIINTITPPNFVQNEGLDFAQTGPLAAYANDENNLFDPAKALEWKEKALVDLKAKGVTFPIKIMLPFNGGAAWASRCQVMKQQMEGLLGADYIEIFIETYSTSFLNSTRRCGNFAMEECNEEATFADPDTYTMMFDDVNNFTFFFECEDVDANGNNLYEVYMEKLNTAKAIKTDITARFAAFAEAEAYLLDNAICIPFGMGVLGAGYVSAKTNPFEFPYSPLGISEERTKYAYVYNECMNTEQYYTIREKWLADKSAANK